MQPRRPRTQPQKLLLLVEIVMIILPNQLVRQVDYFPSQQMDQEMNVISKHSQLLAITHLAQVAAYAEQQLRISKQGDPVDAEIEMLDMDSRVEEIARMMGGIEITEQTRAHAREILEQASG